jgi:uncharacterized repeat protein (TIGR01451 family)
MNKLNHKLAVSSRQSAGKSRLFFLPTAICLLLTIFCLLPTSVNSLGVTANTLISQPTQNTTLSYGNSQGNTFLGDAPEVLGAESVVGVRGLALVDSQVLKTTNPAVATSPFIQNFMNVSSTTVDIRAVSGNFVSVVSSIGTTANWNLAFNYATTTNVPPQTAFIFSSVITPANNARNNAKAAILTSYALIGPTGNQYTGADDVVYGGATTINLTLETLISGPDMKMISRISTINAPAGFSGDAHAAVPGALVSYNIILQNQGTATANSVNIVDRIPTDTTYYSNGGNLNDGNAITAFICLDGSNISTSCTANDIAITRVKFDVGSVLPGKYVTLNYSVVIR